MRTEADRWLGALFHGWVELLTLLAMLLAALAIIGWCWNRGFRPADRGPLVPWALLIVGYGLLLLLRHFEGEVLSSAIVAAGVVAGGLLGRVARPGGLWVPAMLLASLLGLGHHLSALLLTLLTALVLFLSTGRGR